MILLIAVLLVCSMLASLRLKYLRKDWREDHVAELDYEQEGSSLNFNWSDIESSQYRIEISKDGEILVDEELRDNQYSMKDIDYQVDYDVAIYGKNRDGEYVKGARDTIHSRAPQPIEVSTETADGYAGAIIALVPRAEQEVSCTSQNEGIASIDENGIIRLHKVGRTKITLTTEGNEEFLPGINEVAVTCYPNQLDIPTLSLAEKDGAKVVLQIAKSEYADKYIVERKNIFAEEYETFKTITAEEFGEGKTTDITLAKDIGSYRVFATAKVGNEEMKSEMSEELVIESELDSAASYSSITVVKELGDDDIEKIVWTPGGGGASLAQSMCCTGDGYVICFVNRGNKIGRLEKYDRSGKLMAVNEYAGHLGHANGATYDPNTNSIYVMKTYASASYNEIRVFDADTLESKDSTSFPMCPSGIGYDAQMDEFYMTASTRIYITDSNLRLRRTINRKRAYRSQDVCGYNGIVMSCIWTGGYGSYLDMYNEYNGKYLGSIYAPFGEIESACVEDGHLILLYNGGNLYRTKERVSFPG